MGIQCAHRVTVTGVRRVGAEKHVGVHYSKCTGVHGDDGCSCILFLLPFSAQAA